jgi:hypothetical protein
VGARHEQRRWQQINSLTSAPPGAAPPPKGPSLYALTSPLPHGSQSLLSAGPRPKRGAAAQFTIVN